MSEEYMVSSIQPLSDSAIHYLNYEWANYPNREDAFVEREEELRWIQSALRDNAIIVLSGGGGIGKTWLINSFLHTKIKSDVAVFVYNAPSYTMNVSLLHDFFWSLLASLFPKKIPNKLRESARNFYKFSKKDQVDLISDVVLQKNNLIIIDNYTSKYCVDLRELISSIQKKSAYGSKIILSGRQIKPMANTPHLILEGLTKKQLTHFYNRTIQSGCISQEEIDVIWSKTWGIPVLNKLIQSEIANKTSVFYNQQSLDRLIYFEQIQDYLYRLFIGLSQRDKKILKLLMRNHLLDKLEVFAFSWVSPSKVGKKISEEYITRSIVYESSHGIIIPEITKEFFQLIY